MRGTAVPRAWAALEPHFPCASHSRPAHSSRGSEASTQLAFPRKPRFRAFPRICGPQFRAFQCNCEPQFCAFPRNQKPSFGKFRWLYKPRIHTHSRAIRNVVLCIPTKLQIAVSNAAMYARECQFISWYIVVIFKWCRLVHYLCRPGSILMIDQGPKRHAISSGIVNICFALIWYLVYVLRRIFCMIVRVPLFGWKYGIITSKNSTRHY